MPACAHPERPPTHQPVARWRLLGALLLLLWAPGCHAGDKSKMANFWTVQMPFIQSSSYLFGQDYKEDLVCLADLNLESDYFACSTGLKAKEQTRAAGFLYGSFDRKGAYLEEVLECYLDAKLQWFPKAAGWQHRLHRTEQSKGSIARNVVNLEQVSVPLCPGMTPVPVQDTPEPTTAVLRMMDSTSALVYASFPLDESDSPSFDTWRDVLSANVTSDPLAIHTNVMLAEKALQNCHARFDSCPEVLGYDDSKAKVKPEYESKWERTVAPWLTMGLSSGWLGGAYWQWPNWPCAEFAGEWHTSFQGGEMDEFVETVVTCTRGVNTSESNVFCSYSTREMEGFVKGKVSTHGQILEGEFYEMYMTLSDSDGPTSVSNGTCVTGSLSWIAIGWPDTFMGHRLVSGLFSALTALGGNEGVLWYGKNASEPYPAPPERPPCLTKVDKTEGCRLDLAVTAMTNEHIMDTCLTRARALAALIEMIVGSIAAIITACCCFVCYKKRIAPGAPGINIVCCSSNKKVGDDDELGRV